VFHRITKHYSFMAIVVITIGFQIIVVEVG